MKGDLKHRKGRVIFSAHLLDQCNEKFFKLIFSNFYPLAIEPCHNSAYWGDREYYFVSPLFDRVEEGTVIPEYEIIFNDKDGELSIESVNVK